MRIPRLHLENFRNYREVAVEFAAPLTILIGDNAQGKTNLIEAIFCLTLGRSFRTNKVSSLIQYGASEALIGGKVSYERLPVRPGVVKEQQLGVRLRREYGRRRSFYVAGEEVKAQDFFGQFLAVVFRPRDVSELFLNPAWRRNLLDYILCLTCPGYFLDLLNFRRVLRSRNVLIMKAGERGAHSDQLLFWDEEFVRLAAAISKARLALVAYYQQVLPQYYAALSGELVVLAVNYRSQVEQGKGSLTEQWRQLLADNWVQERRLGFTLTGPQRDDLDFRLDKHSLREGGSRGEWRSVLLSLKLAEADYLKRQCGEAAVILLDDVLSELDEKRRQALLAQLSGYQTFVTTTEVPDFLRQAAGVEIKPVCQGKVGRPVLFV